MRTTIDKAGWVVIPAAVRESAGLVAGATIDVTVDETGVRLERVATAPRLVKIGRVWLPGRRCRRRSVRWSTSRR